MPQYYSGEISDHFNGKSFYDPRSKNSNSNIANRSFLSLLKWQLTRKSAAWPKNITLKETDIPPQYVQKEQLRVSNVGHVTFLIQTQGINILTDPVWSERASPISFLGPKRVIEPGIKFDDLPPIDIVWISHNHYDHLDIATLKKLWNIHKPRIITPLGNDTIIHSYDRNIDVEVYDWGDIIDISENVRMHLSPMQHWSARGIFDKNQALWAALTIETRNGNIYFIGDSGYGDGYYFKQDKEKFGNFRLALIPMGAYEPRYIMEYAHMNPYQMLKAYKDLGSPYTIPSHYDVFKLTDEAFGAAEQDLKNAIQLQNSGENIHLLKVGKSLMVSN